ncbi:MAG TPA: sulfatase-like hydrolase/transferase, partial [Gemmatimonadales bacterium]|nr:sulfatase-like hydrolase/transferase [Gemmatimonadales bacterium]
PSHASMFTGREAADLSGDWLTPLDRQFPMLAEYLARQGYCTGGFVGNLIYTNRLQGLARGFQHYEDFPISLGQFILSTGFGRWFTNRGTVRRLFHVYNVLDRKNGAAVDREFLRWQASVRGCPFFAFVNYFDAHEPRFAPDGGTRFGKAGRLGPFIYKAYDVSQRGLYQLDSSQVAVMRDLYDENISYLDAMVQRLVDTLQARGVLDRTVVVVVADHGEQFGEHGLQDHGNSLYLPLLHVPLVMFGPGIPAHTTCPDWVSIRDLATTLGQFASGVTHTWFPGHSLAQCWQGPAAAAPDTIVSSVTGGFSTDQREPIARGNLNGLLAHPYHYIRNGDGTEELYQVEADPTESRNLAGDPAAAQVVATLRHALDLRLPPVGLRHKPPPLWHSFSVPKPPHHHAQNG